MDLDGRAKRLNVLYVDGDRGMRGLMEQVLVDEGYDVRLAFCGRDALDEVRREMPDIVVTEINLPDMDGIEIFQKLLCYDKTLPLIFYTTGFSFKDNFLTWSAEGYVVKGAEGFDILKRTIKRVVRDRSL